MPALQLLLHLPLPQYYYAQEDSLDSAFPLYTTPLHTGIYSLFIITHTYSLLQLDSALYLAQLKP